MKAERSSRLRFIQLFDRVNFIKWEFNPVFVVRVKFVKRIMSVNE